MFLCGGTILIVNALVLSLFHFFAPNIETKAVKQANCCNIVSCIPRDIKQLVANALR